MSKKTQVKNTNKSLIPEKYQDILYIGILILSVFIFFYEAIFTGIIASSDTLASQSFTTYLTEAARSGEFPQWIPYIFGGMPSFASLLTTGERMWDFIPEIFFGVMELFNTIFGNDTARIAMYYVFYAIGMYYLMRSKKKERFVSFFTAFAAAFSTGVIVWVMIGHNTKPVVFSMFPWIFMFMEKVRERFSIIYSVLLAIAIHLMLEAGHVQMIFYGFLAFGIYLIIELISRAINKDMPLSVLRTAAVLIVAGGVAFTMSSDRYLSVLEYTPYSTRGTAPIIQSNQNNQTESGGHDYSYATEWSFSPAEIKTFFVPNFYGFGKLDYTGPETGNRTQKIPTYWGQKIFEDVAPYMGIFVLILAFVGVITNWKNAFVKSLLAISIIALIISFGKTLPILYDLFYYNFPSFNKFRAPSMILALVQFAVPILAGFGLSSIISWKKQLSKRDSKILLGMLGFSALFLILAFIYSSVFQETYIDALANSDSGKRLPANIHNWIYDQMITDWYSVAFILLISVILIWLYVKNKISNTILFSGLFILLVIDLWRVGYRPLEVEEKQVQENYFKSSDVADFLKQDNEQFRILNFNAFPSPNFPAYYELQSAGGYHSAKLRVWQDLLDAADNGNTQMPQNPFIWSLMNVKYIIANQQLQGLQPLFQSQSTGNVVYPNPTYLSRVFFVDSIEIAKPLDILTRIKNGDFDASNLAFLEEKPTQKIDFPATNSTAKITKYENHLIEIEVEASGSNLLYISEMYYPAGWKAFIDGKETEILKTNYAFRSVIVPAGSHKITMKYHSKAFETGKTLSAASNILMILLLALGIYFETKKSKSKIDTEKNND